VLGCAAPRVREVTTTPTALATFRRCPRQYWYRHVLGIDESGGRGRRARLAGLLAHGVLEVVDYAGDLGRDTIAALARTRPETLQLTAADVDAVVGDVVAAAALVRRAQDGGLTVVAREEPVALAVPAASPEVVLHGRIDVVARRRGGLVVQDYKYAHASPARVAEYAEQLAAYRLAVARATGDAVAGEIVFVRGTPEIVALPPLDAEQVEADLLAAGRALGAVAGRRDGAAYPRRPSAPDVCRGLGCGYVRRCWGRDAPEVIGSARDGRRRRGAASPPGTR
jgi:RecB family exonuclease